MVHKKPYYKLTRLAILKDYRKYRLGRELVQALHDWVIEDTCKQTGDKASFDGFIFTHFSCLHPLVHP